MTGRRSQESFALFSAIRAPLLAKPPYPDRKRLVVLDLTDSSTVRPGPPGAFDWSNPKYRMLAVFELTLEATVAYAVRSATPTGTGEATLRGSEYVTLRYMEILWLSSIRSLS